MKVTGSVVKEKPPFVYVRTSRPQSCEHCANSGICNKKEVEICAYNDVGAQTGDYVTVETNDDRSATLLLAYLFLTPLAIFFLSIFLFTVDAFLALIGIPLLILYYLVLRRINATRPVRARVIGPATEPYECDFPDNKD